MKIKKLYLILHVNFTNNTLKRFFTSKWFKYPFYFFIVVFALIGMFLTTTYTAMQVGLTKDGGAVDQNDRIFNEIKDKYNQDFKKDTTVFHKNDFDVYQRILTLNKYCPKNAAFIMDAFTASKNVEETHRMIDAVDMYMKRNKRYMAELKKNRISKYKNQPKYIKGSIFDWMNISEWQDFKSAVAKDKEMIDSVANLTGVESRLIVSVLVGEQIRLFNSKREAYKKWIGPLKILSVETQFSLGVTGIKELTAQDIEKNLIDPSSVYYLGAEYERLLDFKTNNPAKERIDRLISYKNHFYSYMYAAIFIKQVKMQWERAGFPIDDRPEILATLFNVGYPQSVPKKNPKVGGSGIMIYDKEHSFGSISYEFYYSGELFDLFPFEKKRFDWNEL
jgi:hypothetical protein